MTDCFEATYELRNQEHFDRLVIDSWYNNTRFRGNAQSPAKKTQFPGLYTLIPDYIGRPMWTRPRPGTEPWSVGI